MLPVRDRRLLTASVDGELTDLEHQRVDRLLRESSEARRLLHDLQEDARSLRQAPRPDLPIDFAAETLRTIAEHRLSPIRLRTASLPAWLSHLVPWAAAATVLLVLGAASYLFFAVSSAPSGNPVMVEGQPAIEPHTAVASPDLPETHKVNPSPPSDRKAPKSDHPSKIDPPRIVKRPDGEPKRRDAKASPPPAKDDKVLTDRLEMFRFSKVDDALPVILKLHELDQATVRKQLLAELGKAANFRLELPCRNGSKAFASLQTAATAAQLDLLIDKRARDRLQVPALRTSYLVYFEDVTPEELAVFLVRIDSEDRKAIARKKGAEPQFDRLVLTAMTSKDRKELVTLLGIDPTVKKPSSQESLEHYALALAYNGVRPSSGSPEVKRFLENRRSSRPGTLRLLLVLRA